MRLRYTKPDGTVSDILLSDRPLTIGRNPDSDIVLMDDRASRIHCGLRLWDGEYYLKDLKSRNGTFVNGQRIEVVTLKPGDEIRIGQAIMIFDDENAPGPETAINELSEQMSRGKGFTTIMREIAPTEAAKPNDAPAPAQGKGGTVSVRKPGRMIIIKKKPSAG